MPVLTTGLQRYGFSTNYARLGLLFWSERGRYFYFCYFGLTITAEYSGFSGLSGYSGLFYLEGEGSDELFIDKEVGIVQSLGEGLGAMEVLRVADDISAIFDGT